MAHFVNRDPLWLKILTISLTVLFFGVFLFLPVILVFAQGLSKGIGPYFEALIDPATLDAIKLTLITALWVVPLNAIFGIMAAWAVTKYRFRGKAFLTGLIDLPFAVSPVVSGFIFVLIFGTLSPLGQWLSDHDIKIIFNTPGIVIATLFVTFPFVARELIPLMQSLGNDEEEAALTLGARPWQILWRVTLPNIKWGLLYGMVLCNARAIGEFGAVSVISGHVRGLTNTVPLHVEILYSEYKYQAAFAVASVLVLMAIGTLAVKVIFERRFEKDSKSL